MHYLLCLCTAGWVWIDLDGANANIVFASFLYMFCASVFRIESHSLWFLRFAERFGRGKAWSVFRRKTRCTFLGGYFFLKVERFLLPLSGGRWKLLRSLSWKVHFKQNYIDPRSTCTLTRLLLQTPCSVSILF